MYMYTCYMYMYTCYMYMYTCYMYMCMCTACINIISQSLLHLHAG